jgi:hypothetical protein
MMREKKKRPQNVSGIVSDVPGRMRIKLHPGCRRPAFMDNLKKKLETREGMHRVRVNHTNGSLTVHYDRDRLDKNKLLGFLEDLDVVAGEISPAFKGDAPDGVDETGTQMSFLQAIEDLNLRIWRTTGIRLNLKTALPLAFALAGLWSIRKQGLMTTQVPGWILLWLAFDMFVKLHPRRPEAADQALS